MDMDTYKISGYFSLTYKALFVENLSKQRRKDITGNKAEAIAPFILLGQLGKHIEQMPDGSIRSAAISGEDMMRDVFSIIALANSYIINRRVLVECDDNDKLLAFYTCHGFKLLERESEHCTLYLKLAAPDITP